ncbi:major facilitator superfamily domain-containing protein [Phascolomyces articulosus]|uniref:Major facilitator superfamily domain-containing protein n=1 Tax=Phascolomyces articulosus TaxID=60185 RepID=A0AAD5PFG0_9FUNG|nr:major facilitator superfamily domain-containing protein [Phascolomyces articulosus]
MNEKVSINEVIEQDQRFYKEDCIENPVSTNNTETKSDDTLFIPSSVDGKHAWITLTGFVFINLFVGIQMPWGVMQDYYIRNKTFTSSNLIMSLTFIGMLYEVLFMFNIFTANILYPIIHFRILLMIGILFMTGGLLLSSIVNSVAYHLLPKWFVKHRNTASGIFTGAVPFGGSILPLIANKSNENLGYQWTFRILGIIFFSSSIIGFPLVKELKDSSLPSSQKIKQKQRIRAMFDFTLLKNVNLMLWIIVGPIYIYAMYITFTFIPSFATSIGLNDTQGALGVTVLCATSVVGSILDGIIADRIGPLNAFIGCMIIAALTVLLIWMFAQIPSVLITIVGSEKYAADIKLGTIIIVNFGQTHNHLKEFTWYFWMYEGFMEFILGFSNRYIYIYTYLNDK